MINTVRDFLVVLVDGLEVGLDPYHPILSVLGGPAALLESGDQVLSGLDGEAGVEILVFPPYDELVFTRVHVHDDNDGVSRQSESGSV